MQGIKRHYLQFQCTKTVINNPNACACWVAFSANLKFRWRGKIGCPVQVQYRPSTYRDKRLAHTNNLEKSDTGILEWMLSFIQTKSNREIYLNYRFIWFHTLTGDHRVMSEKTFGVETHVKPKCEKNFPIALSRHKLYPPKCETLQNEVKRGKIVSRWLCI